MLRKIYYKIPPHVKLLVSLYFLCLTFFFLTRLLFYFINSSADVNEVTFSNKAAAFLRGIEFDTSLFCWIAIPPVFFWSLASFVNERNWICHIGYLPWILFFHFYIFFSIADIPYFAQFGSHLNKNAFLWKDNPGFVAGMVFGNFSYWGYLLIFLPAAILLHFTARRFYRKFLEDRTNFNRKPIVSAAVFVLLCGLIIAGARGRISDRSPLHEGVAIVSRSTFVNQVAINPNFSFWRSVLFEKRKAYEVPAKIDEYFDFTRKYFGINGAFSRSIKRNVSDSLKRKPNVVLVIMESMSVYKMGYYGGGTLSPSFINLARESVFFDNFFSSGIHTFNGLFSSTSGYPSILSEQPMNEYVKKPFPGLGTLMRNNGYETYFYTTHDPHFDNAEGFYRINGFERFTSGYDFDVSQSISALGVPDHVLFDRVISTTNERKSGKPFLAVVMSASDHGPWKVPHDIPFKPHGQNEKDNAALYADWSIGRFIESVKKQPWYSNTVFLFVGDHGVNQSHTYEMPISYNHVPFVIHQPALFKPDTISYPAYQPDIAATIMGITGVNYENETFGINVLREKHPFVVFSADDKIGCVDSCGYYYYITLSNEKKYLRKYKTLDPANYAEQFPFKADSIHKNMMRVYETANYLIRKNYAVYE